MLENDITEWLKRNGKYAPGWHSFREFHEDRDNPDRAIQEGMQTDIETALTRLRQQGKVEYSSNTGSMTEDGGRDRDISEIRYIAKD